MEYPCSYQIVPIEEVELDENNPRIRKYLDMYRGSPTAEQMYLALGGDSPDPESGSTTTFRSLKESIRTNGGVMHPIIINKSTEGKMLVIEGNTRVAIYRRFKEEQVHGNWDTIPAMVYETLTKEQIDAIRLQAHLVGPRAWDPYSKAKYLAYLRNSEHLTFSQIVDYCGGKEREVADYIDAYEDMEKFYRKVIPDDSAFDHTRFSAFVELQKPGVKASITAANFDYEDFSKWVHDELIYPLNTVRQLPRILSNEESKKMFLGYGAKEALKLLELPQSMDILLKDATMEQLVRVLTEKLRLISYSEVRRLKKKPDSEDALLYFDLREELEGLCEEINSG